MDPHELIARIHLEMTQALKLALAHSLRHRAPYTIPVRRVAQGAYVYLAKVPQDGDGRLHSH